jgi:hypothetical protein
MHGNFQVQVSRITYSRFPRKFFSELFKGRFSFSRTETELKIRNEIERKMQDIQPNVEKEKWLSVWGFELEIRGTIVRIPSALATTLSK